MSPLPQRKKSAEELAQLRESLGIRQPGQPADAPPAAATTEASEAPPARPPSEPKPVRSLRKSEQEAKPSPRLEPLHPSRLPAHRHSEHELQEIRRRNALQDIQSSTLDPRKAPAHLAVVIAGYLFAFVGAALCFPQVHVPIYLNVFGIGLPAVVRGAALTFAHPVTLIAIAEAFALGTAGWIFLRRFYSRHHAAFITMAALLVIIFGALHFFPQLLHAT